MAKKDVNVFTGNVRLAQDARYVAPKKEDGTDAILYFTGGSNDGWADKNGNDSVSWINFCIRGKRATSVKDYFKKGTSINVMARLKTWSTKTEDGKYENHYMMNVNEFTFLGGGNSSKKDEEPTVETTTEVSEADFDTGPTLDISSDDLPF